jgi:hypothetical protein
MSNPIYNSIGANQNLGNLAQRIQQLKKTFSGDPMQQVQRMLNTGQVTQEQYNRAVQQAQELMKAFNK